MSRGDSKTNSRHMLSSSLAGFKPHFVHHHPLTAGVTLEFDVDGLAGEVDIKGYKTAFGIGNFIAFEWEHLIVNDNIFWQNNTSAVIVVKANSDLGKFAFLSKFKT